MATKSIEGIEAHGFWQAKKPSRDPRAEDNFAEKIIKDTGAMTKTVKRLCFVAGGSSTNQGRDSRGRPRCQRK